jgi:hypothetical protein
MGWIDERTESPKSRDTVPFYRDSLTRLGRPADSFNAYSAVLELRSLVHLMAETSCCQLLMSQVVSNFHTI